VITTHPPHREQALDSKDLSQGRQPPAPSSITHQAGQRRSATRCSTHARDLFRAVPDPASCGPGSGCVKLTFRKGLVRAALSAARPYPFRSMSYEMKGLPPARPSRASVRISLTSAPLARSVTHAAIVICARAGSSKVNGASTPLRNRRDGCRVTPQPVVPVVRDHRHQTGLFLPSFGSRANQARGIRDRQGAALRDGAARRPVSPASTATSRSTPSAENRPTP
jgi:hypothetical protein